MTAACSPCFACGGLFADVDGPTHPYMLSSPGCWRAYGDLLAREYEDPALFAAAHRLSVDAYALQHPGDGVDRRAVQSVRIHHAALTAVLEDGVAHRDIPPMLRKLTRRTFAPLPPGPATSALTHADVLARPAEEHVAAVTAWARAVYDAWGVLRAG